MTFSRRQKGLLFLFALLVLSLVALPELKRRYLMLSCQNLSDEEMSEMRDILDGIHRYVPEDQLLGRARLSFNLEAPKDSVFVVFSNLVRAAVHHGPYSRSLEIGIDAPLARDEGADILEFQLLIPGEKRACRWSSDRGEHYWRPGAIIEVDFLPFPTTDRPGEGTPWGYETKVRAPAGR